jgi:uncharacterized protein
MRIKQLTENNIVARALAWLAHVVFVHRRLVLWPQAVLFVLCVLGTWRYLQFDMDRANLVGNDAPSFQNSVAYKSEFPAQDDLVVVVESEDPEKNRQFIERLGAKLERETNLFHNVFYKGDLKMLGSKALLFVPDEDLKDLKNTLGDYKPFIQQFTHTTNLVSLFGMINTQFRTAKQERNAQNESLAKSIPALERIVRQARESMLRIGTPVSPGVTAFFSPDEDAEQQVYITFSKGRIYLATAQALTDDLNDVAVERLQRLVNRTREEVPGLSVGITGQPVLDHDEMIQSQKDTTLASIVSLVLCALLFIYAYRQTGRPLKATACLIVGLGYTLGFATVTVGHLNILTVTFVPILIGLAIDYGVHLISRFEEELRRGRDEEVALTKAMVFTGQGIFTGGLTTAGAFLAMSFTHFKGIQEMGLICGGGLLVCLIPMMTVLPVLLLGSRQNELDRKITVRIGSRRERIEALWLARPRLVCAVIVALSLLALTQLHKVRFDYNLLNMQSQDLPSVKFEKDLLYSTDKSLLYGVVIASNLTQAAHLEQQLTNLSAVNNVESITRFLSEDQTRKLQLVGEIKKDLVPLQFAPPDSRPVNIPELSLTLYATYGYLGAAYEEASKEDPALAKQLLSLRDAIGDLRREMLRSDDHLPQTNSVKLAAFQQALFNDVRGTFEALKDQDNTSPLRVQDLPASLRNRFVGITGKYLLMVYPRKDVWNRENQEEFIRQIQAIYPAVTGQPVELYNYTELLKNSYEEAARYSLVAIALLVLFHFRSLTCLVLALLPVGLGFLWLNGLMGWLGVPYNPANIMTLPLVIGIGVTNGIHILNRYAEEQNPSILARSTGKAVLVSGLTTIIGFGSLMLGKHQGIQSLGCVMSIGLGTCMIAALAFLPSLLNLLARPVRPAAPSGAPLKAGEPT